MKPLIIAVVIMVATLFGAPKTAVCREPHWPETLAIGTASPGGTYFAYGEALARILTRELKTTVWARPTEGPSENIKLLEAGEIELGFVTLGMAQQAWHGTGEWTSGRRFQSMRAIFPMYDTPFQFMVLRDSGILSISELSGKRVGIGPAGGTSGTYVPEFFKLLGVDARLETGSWAELAVKAQEGSLDALAVAAGEMDRAGIARGDIAVRVHGGHREGAGYPRRYRRGEARHHQGAGENPRLDAVDPVVGGKVEDAVGIG